MKKKDFFSSLSINSVFTLTLYSIGGMQYGNHGNHGVVQARSSTLVSPALMQR